MIKNPGESKVGQQNSRYAGWIIFSIDGKYVYPSSGEVIDVKSRKTLTTLQNEFHNKVEVKNV